MTTEISHDGYERIFEGGWVKYDEKALDVCLTTKDLELRSISEQDKPHYLALYSHPETMKLFTDNEDFIAKNGVEKWKERQMTNIAKRVDIWIKRWKEGIPFGAFAIYHKGEFAGHLVAGIGDNPGESEIAYILHTKYWNKGLGSQAVDSVVQKWLPYLQQKGYEVPDDNGVNKVLSVVVATSRQDNEWSNRILVKNGFTKTGEKEAWGNVRNVYQKNI